MGFCVITLLGFFVLPVIVHRLGIVQYGIYGLIMAMLAPMSLANLGFGQATIKYVAEHMQHGDLETASQYLQTTLLMSLVVGVLGSGLLGLLGPPVARAVFQISDIEPHVLNWAFGIAAAGWLINQVSSVYAGVPMAFQRYSYVAVGNSLLSALTTGFGLLFVLSGAGLVGYIFATVLSGFIVLCFWVFVARRFIPTRLMRPGIHPAIWRTCFKFGGWQTGAQVGALVATQSEKILLGAYLSPFAVGIYNISFRLEQTAYSSVFKLAEVLFPAFSAISHQADDRRAALLMRSSWLLSCLAASLLMPLVPLANDILTLWMGAEVAEKGTPVLQALTIGGTLGCAMNASYFFLLGTAKTRSLALVSLVTGLVTISVAWVVLPIFGLPAAGWGSMSGAVAQVFVVSFLLRKMFKRHLSFSRVFFSLYLPVAISLVLGIGIAWLDPIECKAWHSLVLTYGLFSAFLATTVFGVCAVLPYGEERRADVTKISCHVVHLVPGFRKPIR